jgi:transcriptional regulator NrdR family protein
MSTTTIHSKNAAHEYDEHRLKQAIQSAAQANLTPVGAAENIAEQVVKRVGLWLMGKSEITAKELRDKTAHILADFDADTAYFYAQEKQII